MTAHYMADTAGSGAPTPDDCMAVAGYVNGFESYERLVHMYYPHKHILSIATDPKFNAEFLDVESGAAKVTDVGPWLDRMIGKGVYRPGIYCNASTMPAVKEAIESKWADAIGNKWARDRYRLWVADWRMTPQNRPVKVLAGYDAWQFYGTETGPWDYSILAPNFFPDPKAPAKAKRKAKAKKAKPHPKVIASTLTAAIAGGIEAVVTRHGIHLTVAEVAEISTIAGAVAGYLTPGPK